MIDTFVHNIVVPGNEAGLPSVCRLVFRRSNDKTVRVNDNLSVLENHPGGEALLSRLSEGLHIDWVWG